MPAPHWVHLSATRAVVGKWYLLVRFTSLNVHQFVPLVSSIFKLRPPTLNLEGKHIVVTGGAHGIGKGLCRRFAKSGAAQIWVTDLDIDAAEDLATALGKENDTNAKIAALELDVSDADAVSNAIRRMQDYAGPIDLYCSNAGVGYADGAHVAAASDDLWESSWQVNVKAHVYAARSLLPGMLERGSGYFLITASAAGLLSQIGSATYSTTKHAAVGFAESLSIMHGDKGIGVSVLCPQGVATRMMAEVAGGGPQGVDGIISTAEVADAVVDGIAQGSFLILPHPQVQKYMQYKVGDYERWLAGMRKLRDQFPT